MEALVALSLACNVVQLVDFGLKTISSFREIYKDGATIEQQDFKATAQELATLSDDLRKSIQSVPTLTPLARDDEELRQIAVKCRDQAAKLQFELKKLSPLQAGGLRSKVLKTWRSTFKTGPVNDIRNRLLDVQRVLDTKILVGLHQRSKQIALDQEDAFSELHDQLQHFIARLASGFFKSDQVIRSEATRTRNLVTSEHASTRDHITKTLRNLQLGQTADQRKQALIQSLLFPEIKLRQEQIDDAHERTFEWIFDESGEELRPWSCFVTWLKTGSGLYWINGKAGSGKSTLIGFIVSDPRTLDHLQAHPESTNREPLIVSFFFWNAGNVMQKSARGLLQSILHQLLTKEEILFENLAKKDPIIVNRDPNLVWSLRSLRAMLRSALDALNRPLCIFLDGLDEFDEDESELLDIVDILRSYSSVKICASSRPSQLYENAFTGCPRLKLQDLTRTSINTYLRDKLYTTPWSKSFFEADPYETKWFLKQILDKAQGVFLWVKLVVKDITKGLARHDPWAMLYKRVDQLPSDIEKIYERMWSRYTTDLKLYVEDAELFFLMVLHEEISLLQFTVATNSDLRRRCLDDHAVIDLREVLDCCETTRIHVLERCAGLLEVNDLSKDPSERYLHDDPFNRCRDRSESFSDSDEDDKKSDTSADFTTSDHDQASEMQNKTTVSFIHRTARDFVSRTLIDDEEGSHAFLRLDAPCCVLTSRYALWRLDPCAVEWFDLDIELRSIHRPFTELAKADELHEQGQWKDALYELLNTMQRTHAQVSKQATLTQVTRMLRDFFIAGDFLGAVAESGFGEFVRENLEKYPTQSERYLTYLLACTTQDPLERGNMELIRHLLEAGASPLGQSWPFMSERKSALNVTPWHTFLLELATSANDTWEIGVNDLQETLQCFLDRGADIDGPIYWVCGFKSTYYGTSRVVFSSDEDIMIAQATAASLVRHCFGCNLKLGRSIKGGELLSSDDSLKMVMIRRESGQWSRIGSKQDAEQLMEIWSSTERPEDQDLRLFTIDNLERGRLPAGFSPSLTELLRRTSEVIKRSPLFDDEAVSEELAIPGWGLEAAQILLEYCGWTTESYEERVAEWNIPRQLLEGVELDWEEIRRLKESQRITSTASSSSDDTV